MISKSLFRTCFVLLCILGRGPVANATIPQFTDSDIEHPAPTQDTKNKLQRSLSGLFSVQSFRAHNLYQPHDQFDELYAQAEPAQKELEQLLTEISLHSSTTPQLPGVKSEQRAKDKIATELDGHVEHLTDMARGTLIAKDIPSLVHAFEQISKEATVVEVKNRFKQPAPSGYRDLKLLVQLPQTNIIAEVQLHLDSIAALKSGPEHVIYEQIQQTERTAQAENRDLNDIETARISQLRKQTQEMYQQAWHQYLQPETVAQTALKLAS
ncbi:phosphoribosylglycinamide formyltransferase [Photobacterium sanctipauli]|uniref:Phosphoribosylglycinamide formyltransferase n=1 Tax=Photobacterium sanctipauli TaxID=1342794 RepID=A0A2T3P0A4_9GAMM|nr:phosphoribosylglycinamide formyltransferase [Photobacterium sanctipauli]PSW21912.1 phosphoribosylglycinamide formyltransferase [Photobacterium sanctipauli]